ncbi:MAG: hypothetical protein HOP34_13090, partial [Methylococcaceae bacterium]|nr:hypothetical protein [Methylococcaceae bacterium]
MPSFASFAQPDAPFNCTDDRTHTRLVAVFLLIVVVLVHIALTWFIINMPPATPVKPIEIMEVVMVT